MGVRMTHWSGPIFHLDLGKTERSAEIHIIFVRASEIFFSVRTNPMFDIALLRYPSRETATSSMRRLSEVRDHLVRISKRDFESVRKVIGICPFGANLPQSEASVKARSKRSMKAMSSAAITDRVTRRAL